MDVSLEADAMGPCCDLCGYSRRGISTDARCPECGEPPPKLAHSTTSAVVTVEELSWLRTIAPGLWLLIIASIGSLQVALIMPIGAMSLPAVNFPGPKLNAAAMIQRSIGGQPGPWGVAACGWAIAGVLAVWLLTEPRTLRGEHETGMPLRRLARWVGVLTVGGMLGLLLCGTGDYIAPRRGDSKLLFFLAVGVCELPANTLLYLHLRNLAKRFGDRRSAALLGICTWAVPGVIAAAPVLIAVAGQAAEAGKVWTCISAVYGAAALATCAAATAAVARLACIATVVAFGSAFTGVIHAVRSAPGALRRAAIHVDTHLARWCIVTGLLIWLWGVPDNLESALSYRLRSGLAGDVPTLNFAGPKVGVARITTDDLVSPSLWNVLAVWLITIAPRDIRRGPNWRRTARVAAIIAVGVPLGIMLGLPAAREIHPPYAAAWSVAGVEAPATFVLYLYLTSLAVAVGRPGIAKTLKRLAWIIPVIALAPLSAFVLSISLQLRRSSLTVGILSAAFVMLTLSVTLFACTAVLRLAWAVARPMMIVDTKQAEPLATRA